MHISFLCKNRVNNRGRRKSFHVLKQEAQGERQDSTKQPPLGYWLKHAYEVITKHVNHVLSEQGFTRFHWQVLNIVYEAGTIARKDVFNTMKTLIQARHSTKSCTGSSSKGG